MQTLPISTQTPASQTSVDTMIHRRQTRPVQVGTVTIGGGHPVVVQSMINEDTMDIEGATAAVRRLHDYLELRGWPTEALERFRLVPAPGYPQGNPATSADSMGQGSTRAA